MYTRDNAIKFITVVKTISKRVQIGFIHIKFYVGTYLCFEIILFTAKDSNTIVVVKLSDFLGLTRCSLKQL